MEFIKLELKLLINNKNELDNINLYISLNGRLKRTIEKKLKIGYDKTCGEVKWYGLQENRI